MIKNLIILTVLVIVLWGLANFVRIRILSSRAGKIIQNTTKFERKTEYKQKILVLGDSIAYGTGTSSPEKSVAGLVAAHYPNANVENRAQNGKRTKDLAKEVESITGSYDLILIVVGGNDILRPWINLDESANNLAKIYKNASTHSTKVIALTTGNFKYTTLFLWPANYYFSSRSIQLRNSAVKIAEEIPNLIYVNIVDYNEKVPFDTVKEAPDHLHLSDDGANYWMQAILDTTEL